VLQVDNASDRQPAPSALSGGSIAGILIVVMGLALVAVVLVVRQKKQGTATLDEVDETEGRTKGSRWNQGKPAASVVPYLCMELLVPLRTLRLPMLRPPLSHTMLFLLDGLRLLSTSSQ
jgi:hypothetical protein